MTSIAAGWRSLGPRILQHRVQLGLSVRVTIAALLAFTLSLWLHLPLPLWTVLTAVILTQVNFGRSLKATVDYLAGTVGGAVYAGAVAALIPHSNDIELAGVLAIAVAPLALLGAIVPSFSAATFTGVLVLLLPGITHGGPIEAAFYRVIEVAVGGLTALAVSLLVLPTRARSLTIAAASQMLALAARSLPELLACVTEARDWATIRRIQDGLGQAFTRLDAIAREAQHERFRFLAAEPDPGPLLRALLRLRHNLVMIGRAGAVPLPETLKPRLGPPLARVAETVAHYLAKGAEALALRREPSTLDAAEAAFDDYAAAFAAVRRDGLTRDLPEDAAERIFTLAFALEQMRHNLNDIDGCAREAAHRT